MRTARVVAAVTTALAVIAVMAVSSAPAVAAPKEWDPRIADLAEKVERLRGLDFDEPVPVRVLDDTAFDARYRKNQKTTKAARAEFARTNASLRALGLLEKPMDLDSLTNAFGSHVLGYYDIHRKEIVVRGDTFESPSTRAVLVHELTHALQDQHFDIRRLNRVAREAESSVPRALIEGDATRIEERYRGGLSGSERQEIANDNSTAIDRAAPLPPIIQIVSSGSYWLGEVVTVLLESDDGQDGIDDSFREPPVDDVVLLDPAALLSSFHATKVRAPALAEGEHQLGKSYRFGAWSLYLVLASRLPAADALAAAERWGGDSYVIFERGTTPCVRVAVDGRRGRDDAEKLDRAFQAWAAAAPSDATTDLAGNTVTLTSCMPGEPAPPVSEAALSRALIHLTLRNSLAVSGLSAGLDPDQSKCLGTEVLELPEVSPLVGAFTSINDDGPADFDGSLMAAVSEHASELRARCT